MEAIWVVNINKGARITDVRLCHLRFRMYPWLYKPNVPKTKKFPHVREWQAKLIYAVQFCTSQTSLSLSLFRLIAFLLVCVPSLERSRDLNQSHHGTAQWRIFYWYVQNMRPTKFRRNCPVLWWWKFLIECPMLYWSWFKSPETPNASVESSQRAVDADHGVTNGDDHASEDAPEGNECMRNSSCHEEFPLYMLPSRFIS